MRASQSAGMPLACVIGDMDLVRPLGLAGVPVAAVTAQPDAATRYSRFCKAVVQWPHPADDPGGAVAALAAFGASQEKKPVLFCQGDTDLLLVSRHREALAPHFHLTVDHAEMVEDLVDKLRFAALAERLSLPVPPTRIIRASADVDAELVAAAAGMTFPCVLKPVTRRKWTGFGSGDAPAGGVPKAARLESRADLMRLGPSISRLGCDFLLQGFVPGGEDSIVSYHAWVDPAGGIAADFTGRKIRTYPLECGFTTSLEITDDARVRELGRDVLSRIGYRGVVKLDFKEDVETGDIRLLELNPRFNLWHHPGAVAGVNLPLIAYRHALGQPLPPAAEVKPGVKWCWLWKDLAAYRQTGGSLCAWLRFAARADTYSVVSLDDPMPFVRGVLLRGLSRLVARLAGRASQPRTAPAKPATETSGA